LLPPRGGDIRLNFVLTPRLVLQEKKLAVYRGYTYPYPTSPIQKEIVESSSSKQMTARTNSDTHS
jgi:hypothetical protein